MGVHDPGELTVECDECGAERDFPTIEYGGGEGPTFGVDEESLEEAGWERLGSDFLCPGCLKEMREDDE